MLNDHKKEDEKREEARQKKGTRGQLILFEKSGVDREKEGGNALVGGDYRKFLCITVSKADTHLLKAEIGLLTPDSERGKGAGVGERGFLLLSGREQRRGIITSEACKRPSIACSRGFLETLERGGGKNLE